MLMNVGMSRIDTVCALLFDAQTNKGMWQGYSVNGKCKPSKIQYTI